jgi:hypothetical protein
MYTLLEASIDLLLFDYLLRVAKPRKKPDTYTHHMAQRPELRRAPNLFPPPTQSRSNQPPLPSHTAGLIMMSLGP